MSPKFIFIPLLILAMVTMACGITINLPITQVKTGPTQTDQVAIPLPANSSDHSDIRLDFGAGELRLAPGAENALVSGTFSYNVPDFKPVVTVSGTNVHIEQGNLNIKGFPNFQQTIKNTWDLKFGNQPIKLQINAGAYNGNFELGGLFLEDLQVSDGASDVQLAFSKPNLTEMASFGYSTGASTVTLKELANANFKTMSFKSGAGSYKLDFSGALQRDASVTIDSGVSSVSVSVPQGISARLSFEGGLSNVNISGAWQKSGNSYTQQGSGPTLTITVKMGAGSLDLSN